MWNTWCVKGIWFSSNLYIELVEHYYFDFKNMRNILYIKKIVYRTNYCLSLRLSILLSVGLSFSLYKTLRLSICIYYLDVIPIIKTALLTTFVLSWINTRYSHHRPTFFASQLQARWCYRSLNGLFTFAKI